MKPIRCGEFALGLAAVAAMLATLQAVPARACAIATPEVASGVVRGVVQGPAADASPWTPDFPGAILELQGPAGLVRFHLSRNIGITLDELRARAQSGRMARVKYERLYDGRLRALEIEGAEPGS